MRRAMLRGIGLGGRGVLATPCLTLRNCRSRNQQNRTKRHHKRPPLLLDHLDSSITKIRSAPILHPDRCIATEIVAQSGDKTRTSDFQMSGNTSTELSVRLPPHSW